MEDQDDEVEDRQWVDEDEETKFSLVAQNLLLNTFISDSLIYSDM